MNKHTFYHMLNLVILSSHFTLLSLKVTVLSAPLN